MSRELTALLAVDVGVRTGLAGFDADGRLLWWGSRNFGSVARLKKGIPAFLPGRTVVVEGDGRLAVLWRNAARQAGLDYHWLSAETWREALLLQRERRTGERAKATAVERARELIREHGLSPPRSLGHDAAEAILVGFWALVHLLDTSAQPPGNEPSTSE